MSEYKGVFQKKPSDFDVKYATRIKYRKKETERGKQRNK